MKNILKIYSLIISPLWYIMWNIAKLQIHPWHFYYWSIFISKIPFIFWDQLRYWFYKTTLKFVWKNVQFMYWVVVQNRETIIWNNIIIWMNSIIGSCIIWDYVMMWVNVQIIPWGKSHWFENISKPMMTQKSNTKKILNIWNDIRIWSWAIIMNDIMNHSIIWSWSIVTKIFNEYDIIAWNPAKFIKNRKANEIK